MAPSRMPQPFTDSGTAASRTAVATMPTAWRKSSATPRDVAISTTAVTARRCIDTDRAIANAAAPDQIELRTSSSMRNTASRRPPRNTAGSLMGTHSTRPSATAIATTAASTAWTMSGAERLRRSGRLARINASTPIRAVNRSATMLAAPLRRGWPARHKSHSFAPSAPTVPGRNCPMKRLVKAARIAQDHVAMMPLRRSSRRQRAAARKIASMMTATAATRSGRWAADARCSTACQSARRASSPRIATVTISLMTKPTQDRGVIDAKRGSAMIDLSPSTVIPLFQPSLAGVASPPGADSLLARAGAPQSIGRSQPAVE